MIPNYIKPPINIPVQALRDLAAKHGHDVAVLVTWTHEEGCGYRFVTAGCNERFAQGAFHLSQIIEAALKLPYNLKLLEDFRSEHPAISSTTLMAFLNVLHYELPTSYEQLTPFQQTLINPQQFAEIERERVRAKAVEPDPAMYVRFTGKHDGVIKQLAKELDMDPQKVAEHALAMYQLYRLHAMQGHQQKWFDKAGVPVDEPTGCGDGGGGTLEEIDDLVIHPYPPPAK